MQVATALQPPLLIAHSFVSASSKIRHIPLPCYNVGLFTLHRISCKVNYTTGDRRTFVSDVCLITWCTSNQAHLFGFVENTLNRYCCIGGIYLRSFVMAYYRPMSHVHVLTVIKSNSLMTLPGWTNRQNCWLTSLLKHNKHTR